MASSMMAASSQSISAWLGGPVGSAFTFEGIHVHPSHFAPASDTSSNSSVLSYMADEEEHQAVSSMEGLELGAAEDAIPQSPSWSRAGSSCGSSSAGTDYFSYSTTSTATSSPTSSGYSTPTREFPEPRKGSSSSTMARTCPTTPTISSSSAFDATFSFDSFSASPVELEVPISPTTERNSSSSSSQRGLPYPRRAPPSCRTGAASMVRSYSTPVETQRQLDLRRTQLSAVAAAMDSHVGSTGMGRAGTTSTMMGRQGSTIASGSKDRFPLVNLSRPLPVPTYPYGADWGSALPPREHAATPPMPVFPYNMQSSPLAPSTSIRITRARSINTGEENRPKFSTSAPHLHHNHLTPTLARHNSVPNTMEGVRPRRTTILTAMTPIVVRAVSPAFANEVDIIERPSAVSRGLSY